MGFARHKNINQLMARHIAVCDPIRKLMYWED
jgi:hypothetical protein